MNDILIVDWISKCEQFCEDHQIKHDWSKERCLHAIWCGIVSTKYLNLTLIEKFIEICSTINSAEDSSIRRRMSLNPALTLERALAHPEFKWECSSFSSRCMNINDILNHPELEWDWFFVSQNLSVTMEIILANIDEDWSWKCLSRHPNVTMSDIESRLHFPWSWGDVSYNSNLTMTIIEAYPDNEWDWYGISCGMKLTVDLLRQNVDKPWQVTHMSRYNSSITLELLLTTISQSLFNYGYDIGFT